MTNRREFLQIGITAGAWPIAASAARAAGGEIGAGAGNPETVPLYKAVYDSRFADSVAFARRVERLGVPAQAIEGDVTRFWYEELYHEWRKAPVAIAGLTAHGPLFCLERLAWDQGMRVVFRAEHEFHAHGCIEHDLSGPLTMLHRSVAVTTAAGSWSTEMAEVVASCPRGRAEISTTRFTAAAGARPAQDVESLYSWVIAPAARA